MKEAFLYCRVSTDEQKQKNNSIPAQIRKGKSYCKEKNIKLKEIFIDDGYSAHSLKRPELQRMLQSIKSDASACDLILFTNLDRFTRMGRDYWKLMDILEPAGVHWDAMLEDYDTTTSNGQLMLEVKLAVTNNELKRGSERLKFIFDDKIEKGGVASGSITYGYKIVDKKPVKDPDTFHIARFAFLEYAVHPSYKRLSKTIYEQFGVKISVARLKRMLGNVTYLGWNRNNKNWCPPAVSEKEFDIVQELRRKNVKEKTSKRTYIFSGLLKCGICKNNLSGNHSGKGRGDNYNCYRCETARKSFNCDCNKVVGEKYIEEYLTNNILSELSKYEVKITKMKSVKNKRKNNIPILKKQLTKLKDLYLDDLIDKQEYATSYNDIKIKLELEERKHSEEGAIESIKETKTLFDCNFFEMYEKLDPLAKNSFWKKIIEYIEVDWNNDKALIIHFKDKML